MKSTTHAPPALNSCRHVDRPGGTDVMTAHLWRPKASRLCTLAASRPQPVRLAFRITP